jgi:hypothetical protein
MTDIPHCSTCPHKRITHHGNECKVSSTFLPLPAESLIAYVGCLSHPDARAYLMADVIEELTTLLDIARLETIDNTAYPLRLRRKGEVRAYEVAISLIKNGVK